MYCILRCFLSCQLCSLLLCLIHFFFSSRRRHTSGALVTGVQTCALPISLDDLLGQADVVVDCTPKRVAAQNAEIYRASGLKFIVHGGEKHAVTGHSFVAEVSFNGAVGRAATRVVSCNPTSIVRTLTALNRVGLLKRARRPEERRVG